MTEAYLAPDGLSGDAWAHPGIHGGPDKAVLLIGSESIEELRALGFDVYPGALGENFTTTGLDRRQMRPGDRYRAGQAIIEITSLRQPCSALDVYNVPGSGRIQEAVFDRQVKSGDATSPRWGLGGFYARVVRAGLVRAGDAITHLDSLA